MAAVPSAVPKGKVLVAITSSDHVTLTTKSGEKQQETGFFLKELGMPLASILEAGYDVVFANKTGTAPHMDPFSDSKMWFASLGSEYKKEKELLEKMAAEKSFSSPRTFSSFSEAELDQFTGIMFPGGHGPMDDMWNDPDLGRILLHFHNKQRPTGLICHAPIALLSTKIVQQGQPWAYQGYKMTCYSDREDALIELMWMGKLPYKVETELRNNGAQMVEALPMMVKVTVDRELITAQGPTSASQFGKDFVKALESHNMMPVA